jgi:thymidylate kinase
LLFFCADPTYWIDEFLHFLDLGSSKKLEGVVTRFRFTTTTMLLISVEGNIGAGKSTFLERLQREWPDVTVVMEPVGMWMSVKDSSGKSLLDYFYEDKQRWSYTFQTCAFLTRMIDTENVLASVSSAKPDGKPVVIITERSVLTDRYVFADMLRKDGAMNELEYDLYCRWFDRYARGIPVEGIIYLETDPGTSLTRISTRGRGAEAGIGLDYLEALESQHQSWLSSTKIPVYRLSANDGELAGLKTWISELSKA